MTQQYLNGQLSVLLAQLESVARDEPVLPEVVRLRREAEVSQPAALVGVLGRALAVTDELCWRSLSRGDVATFGPEAAIGADMREFGLCAGLLEEAE